jgi:hypothetical protein
LTPILHGRPHGVTIPLALAGVLSKTRRVLVFWLLGYFPMVLLLTFALSLYLAFIETRQQHMDWRHTLWWLQLTFLFHFVGYLVLRGWVFYRRHRAPA